LHSLASHDRSLVASSKDAPRTLRGSATEIFKRKSTAPEKAELHASAGKIGITDAALRSRNTRPYRPLRCKFIIHGSITASTFTFDNHLLFLIYFLPSRDRCPRINDTSLSRDVKDVSLRFFVSPAESSTNAQFRQRFFFEPFVKFDSHVSFVR